MPAPNELLTIRLDPALRHRLREAARRRGLTASASVRLGIEAWLAAEQAGAVARPYPELADVLGRVDLSSRAAPGARRARRGGAR